MKKHLNVRIEDFLREILNSNTKHFREDFSLDQAIFRKACDSKRREDKVLLWLSRENGTQCVREYETFMQGTSAHQTWLYYAHQESSNIRAYTVEIVGRDADGKIVGNVYDLDFQAHAKDVEVLSVPVSAVEKTFEDGFILSVPIEQSSYGFYSGLVEEHGRIVDSKTVPENPDQLRYVLSEQRMVRNQFPLARENDRMKKPFSSLDGLIKAAETEQKETIRSSRKEPLSKTAEQQL